MKTPEQPETEHPSNSRGEQLADELQQVTPDSKDVYLLGGNDYEMERVRKMLNRRGVDYEDKQLGWEDADVSSYQEDISRILAGGNTPIAIELRGASEVPGVVEIDHHNQNSERPASIAQVLERLGLKPSLVNKLAAANDAAYYPGMDAVIADELDQLKEKGYNDAQLERARSHMVWLEDAVRTKDREAQGVTPEMEQEAEEAITNAEHGPNGLLIVRVTADRYSQVADRLYHTWPEGKQNLIIVCNSDKDQKEVWFQGRGDFCKDTVDHYKELKAERIATIPGEPERRGVYHAWGGGSGFGKEGENAQCGVVAENPDEVIQFIEAAQGAGTS